MERYFAPCPRGLETALADELERLRADDIALHLAVLLAYASFAYYVALVLTRRRLLK